MALVNRKSDAVAVGSILAGRAKAEDPSVWDGNALAKRQPFDDADPESNPGAETDGAKVLAEQPVVHCSAGSARKVCHASGPPLRMYQRPMHALRRGSNPSCPRRPIMSRPPPHHGPLPCLSPLPRPAPDGRLAPHRVNGENALALPPARSRPTSPRHPQRPSSDARSRPVEHPGLVSCPLHTCAS